MNKKIVVGICLTLVIVGVLSGCVEKTYDSVEYSGIFKGYWEDDASSLLAIKLDNQTIKPIRNLNVEYIQQFAGKNITVLFKGVKWDTGYEEYRYLGAYLNE